MTARTRTAEPAHRRTFSPTHRHSVEAGSEAGFVRAQKSPPKDAHFAAVRRARARVAEQLGVWPKWLVVVPDVLDALWGYRNRTSGQCTPSFETLAQSTGHCRDSVIKAVAWLRERDFLGAIRRFVMVKLGRGREAKYEQTSNAYWFKLPPAAQALLAHRHRKPPPCDAEDDVRRRKREMVGALLAAGDAEGCPNAAAATAAFNGPQPSDVEEELTTSVPRMLAAQVTAAASPSPTARAPAPVAAPPTLEATRASAVQPMPHLGAQWTAGGLTAQQRGPKVGSLEHMELLRLRNEAKRAEAASRATRLKPPIS